MPACISISKRFLLFSLAVFLLSLPVYAAGSAEKKDDKVSTPEEDDYSTTPYTGYGEFDEDREEAENAYFYQHGRFFGLSLGTGYEGALGNRGKLWDGAFPIIDIRLHYWFDMNFAMDIGFYSAHHSYVKYSDRTTTDVGIFTLGTALKYYFDTQNLSSAITFANPYVLGGIGTYREAKTAQGANSSADDHSFGANLGFGMEFALSHKRTYFYMEARMHFPHFKDADSNEFNNPTDGGFQNLNGPLYTLGFGLFFCW